MGSWAGILLAPLDLHGPDIEIGWRLKRAAWGFGYATEAARPVLDHAFGMLRLAEVVADIDPANTASAGVARKLGLRPAGQIPPYRWTHGDTLHRPPRRDDRMSRLFCPGPDGGSPVSISRVQRDGSQAFASEDIVKPIITTTALSIVGAASPLGFWMKSLVTWANTGSRGCVSMPWRRCFGAKQL